MSRASFVEDIEERRIDDLILQPFAQFENAQLEGLRACVVTEASLCCDLETLRQRIVAPLEAIRNKMGAEGGGLGNQLLKLQLEINDASTAMTKILTELSANTGGQTGSDASLSQFLQSFVNNYRLLLRVIQVIAQPLRVDNRKTLDQIRSSCEDDIKNIESLPRTLMTRQEGIARLYAENEALKKSLDKARQSETADIDASGYSNFGRYVSDMGITKLRK
jgi:hypothetical protein